MHICYVSTQYLPDTNYGGIAAYVYNTSRAMARRGHKVTVVSVTHSGKGYRKLQEGVEVWRFEEPHYRRTLREHLKRNWQVWQAVQDIKPELVQLVDYDAEGFLLSLLNRGRYKIITRLADDAAITDVGAAFVGKTLLETVQRRTLNYMARQQARHSNLLFAPGRAWAARAESYNKWPPGTVRHLYNGLDLAEIEKLRQVEPDPKIEGPYLIYFGRLEERKGVQYLAQAMPLIWEKLPYLKLVLAGDYEWSSLEGELPKDYFERWAGDYEENLIFTGQLTRERLFPLVARARLAILPSIREMFGFTCAEALALGVPVVTTIDSGGPAEIVGGLGDPEADQRSLPAGWLVPGKNVPALAAAVIEAISNGQLLARARLNACQRAEYFDIERVADRLEKLYQEVLENDRN